MQKRDMSNTQAPLTKHPINKMLPVETFMLIFEEHAKVEWRAPSIDGRVCRLWRQIILNTPRAWSYLEVGKKSRPSIVDLRSWLRRSATAPLHIRIFNSTFYAYERMNTGLNNLLCEYHTRIASLRMREGKPSLFEGRDFLSLQHLDIEAWSRCLSPPGRWGLMPQLRSLRLGDTNFAVQPLDGLFSLEYLALFYSNCAFLPQHSPSLTTLMLETVSLEGIISGPVSFPSLTYLSLYDVTGLKPYIDAPHLVTYHEGGGDMTQSFTTPLQSITEYGVYYKETAVPDLTAWHPAFTNVSRLSIRAYPMVLVPLFDSLASHLHVFPALRTICVGMVELGINFIENVRKPMMESVQVRSRACGMDIALYFGPSQIPIFFGRVSH